MASSQRNPRRGSVAEGDRRRLAPAPLPLKPVRGEGQRPCGLAHSPVLVWVTCTQEEGAVIQHHPLD